MAINEALEERVAANRSKNRQNKAVPWLIREDGMILPNVPLIAKKQNFRPYHGDPAATLEERMQYLAGMSSNRRRKVMLSAPIDDDPFDIAKATKDELIAFAMDEYSEPIDPEEHINKIRAQVAKLAGIDYNSLFKGAEKAAAGLQKD